MEEDIQKKSGRTLQHWQCPSVREFEFYFLNESVWPLFRINFGFAWLRFGHIFGNRTGGEISMLFVFGIPIAAHASKGIRRDSESGTIVADTVQRHDRNLPTVMIRTRTATNSSLVRTKSSSPWALAAFRDMVDRVGGRPRVGRRIRSGVEKDPGTPTIARPPHKWTLSIRRVIGRRWSRVIATSCVRNTRGHISCSPPAGAAEFIIASNTTAKTTLAMN